MPPAVALDEWIAPADQLDVADADNHGPTTRTPPTLGRTDPMTSTTTPIPTSGYTAWFLAPTGRPFALPVVALAPRLCSYSLDDDTPVTETEWEPAVLTVAGTLLPVYEAEQLPPLVGGVFIGLAPTQMPAAEARAYLENSTVGPLSDDEENMVGRVTAAERELTSRPGWVR